MAKTNFEQNYFTTRYADITGGFTEHDMQKNINCYWSWFILINKHIKLLGEFTFMEIGCGISAFSSIVYTNYPKAKILATDISKYAIDKIKNLVPYQTEILDIGVNGIKNKYDMIVAFEVSNGAFRRS